MINRFIVRAFDMKAFDIQDYKNFMFEHVPPLQGRHIQLHLTQTLPACPLTQRVPVYYFSICLCNQLSEIGYIEFRVGNTPLLIEYDGHIGYGVDAEYRGNNYSLEAFNLLKPFIKAQGFEKIILTCHPDNISSKKIIEKLNGIFIERKAFENVRNGADKERLRFQLLL